jgi:hypothetical protein
MQAASEARCTMRDVIILIAALSLVGCVAAIPSRVDSTNATVTYKYSGEKYGSQFDLVSAKASDYCGNEFGKSARLRDVDKGNEENFATFECVQHSVVALLSARG